MNAHDVVRKAKAINSICKLEAACKKVISHCETNPNQKTFSASDKRFATSVILAIREVA